MIDIYLVAIRGLSIWSGSPIKM